MPISKYRIHFHDKKMFGQISEENVSLSKKQKLFLYKVVEAEIRAPRHSA